MTAESLIRALEQELPGLHSRVWRSHPVPAVEMWGPAGEWTCLTISDEGVRMDGFDADWQYLGSANLGHRLSEVVRRLAAGDYTLS